MRVSTLVAGAAALALAGPALAQTNPNPNSSAQAMANAGGEIRAGMQVRSFDGASLGEVVEVTRDRRGRPDVVRIRTADGQVRRAPVSWLNVRGDAVMTGWSQAQIMILPTGMSDRHMSSSGLTPTARGYTTTTTTTTTRGSAGTSSGNTQSMMGQRNEAGTTLPPTDRMPSVGAPAPASERGDTPTFEEDPMTEPDRHD